jgi:TamB, inner membrane protein subunit of TAM complex
MLKNIKKSLKYFIIVFGVILLLPTVLYLLVRTPEVQTFMVNKISKHFSNELKSTISFGSIEFKFFNRLSINNLLVKDKNNDTLLYSRDLVVGLRWMNFKNKSFRLGKVSIINPVVELITDSTGQMNLAWYLNLLKNPDDTLKKPGSRIRVDQIDVRNARFSLVNKTGINGKTRMNFNNLQLADLNGIIEDLRVENDSTTFSLFNLTFRESSGFFIQKMNSSVSIARQNIVFNSATINCEGSMLNIPRFALLPDSVTGFKDFAEKVKLNLILDRSLISTTELKYFIPFADSLTESVWLSGKIMGTVSELRGRNVKLSYRNFTSLDCDFDFSGLPKIESAYLYIGVNSLKTNAKDLEHVSLPRTGLLVVPDVIKNLGNISFNGSFTGFTTDFVTYGEIKTSMGNIRTDLSLRPEEADTYKIKGLITGSNIDIGELSGNPDLLGNMSMQANIDGYASSFKKFSGNLTGRVDSIEINKYLYRNITLNGSFTEKTWDGSINVVDKNIKLDLLGLLNFKNTLPEFDFTLNIADANLYKLNFDKTDTTSKVTLLLTSNFKGSNIDNLDGEIKLLNSSFTKFGDNLDLYNLSIRTYKETDQPVLSLRTDFVDADIKGHYNFAALGDLVKSTLVRLMPSQFHFSQNPTNLAKNKFTFNINFKNTDKINKFFKTGILIADKSFIKGSIFADSVININGKTDQLTFKNNVFQDFSFDAMVEGSALKADISSSTLSLLKQSDLKDFAIRLNTRPDNFNFRINWDNKDTLLNKGSFLANGTVEKTDPGKKYAILKVDIDSSRIYVDNNLWKLSHSSILIDSSSISVSRLFMKSKDRSYLIDGSVSENPKDTLHLDFRGIDIAPLNYLLSRRKNNDPQMIPLDFKGQLNGKILISNVYKSLLLAGDIVVDNFAVLGSDFGKITINSDLDNAKKIVNIKASNNLNSTRMFNVTGTYDPSEKKIDLFADADKLPITFLNPLLKVFASDITGYASGKLHFTSHADHIYLQGAAMVNNGSLKINYLQTKYTMSDSVRFDKEGIKFNNVKVKDIKGNIATLSGSVDHNNFRDYSADLIINIVSREFQVLNTQPKDNQLFYGTVYASGSAKIKSDQNLLSFDVVATTGKNSRLAIPISKGLSVSEYSYITFATKDKKTGQGISNTSNAPAKPTGMELTMNLEVTPDAEVQIIFDSKVGDVMKGHGSSKNLNITLNRSGDFGIYGDYLIEDGDYTFTFGNIVNKTFSVENGGKIMFNGNLKDAEIDLKASYLNLKASLMPILGEEKYAERIPVEPQLNLSGKLFNPIVGFDIYLPDADEATRSYLRNAISTEEELTKQVFALLLMNSFISMGATSSTVLTSTTTNGTSAMTATTFEMLSNQISNWLSQLSKDVDIGINIRPGSNTISPQEAEVALSTQVLNNKVVLNGNFDVRGTGATTNNTNQLTGDFDAELKLTEKMRLKVFNRYNDTYAGTGLSPYTQGVGIFYKQDFNRFSDLFRKKNKADIKKEDETKVKSKK